MSLFHTPTRTWSSFSKETPVGNWGCNIGGGVNSTAELLFMYDRGLRPDWAVFSDTGSERPETYDNIQRIEDWCKKVGFPFAITRWIRKDGTFESLHDNCERLETLPSKAFGMAGCTVKWKIQPLQKWRRENGHTPTTVAIGYDRGEIARLRKARERDQKMGFCATSEEAPDEDYWYPLAAWGISRKQCEDRIRSEGWTPAKSACFFCPNMKNEEWEELQVSHPRLFQISLDMQAKAEASGNAKTASIFRNPPGDGACVCSADGCGSSLFK